ncbi:MAG: LPXTG cell wall anchor domain-containing protein [Spirochaetales bacterium]|nr:LPXTG cell wall anchor domain-containing protein [Spirochaetales bacterium]
MYPYSGNLAKDGRNTGIEVIILIITGLLLVLLLVLLLRKKSREPAAPAREEVKTGLRNCPLCGEVLKPGENVKSVLYPAAGNAPDRMMEIHGCPHCYPAGAPRRCPVCKKELQARDLVIARCFQKPGKTHVHVLGCTQCYSGSRHGH